MLNTPQQHRTAMEFDQFYPLLLDLTAESMVIRSAEECAGIGERLGFPVFVRGAVKSNKDQGWGPCLAVDEAALVALTQSLLSRPDRSRGRVIVRRLMRLRHTQTTRDGFPVGREYRVFLYQGDVLAFSYCWDEYRDAWGVSSADEQTIAQLAKEAARRLSVPYLAVDIGQLDTGSWIVIEVADAQLAGLSHVSVLGLWSRLKDIAWAPPGL